MDALENLLVLKTQSCVQRIIRARFTAITLVPEFHTLDVKGVLGSKPENAELLAGWSSLYNGLGSSSDSQPSM